MTCVSPASVTSTVSVSSRALVLLVAVSAGLMGCAPTCQQVCRKLDRCELNGDVQLRECAAACEQEISDFRDTDDKEGKATFNDQRRCLRSSSCDEIASGACYDEALFPFERQ